MKKLIVGGAAVISSIISLCLWIWFAHIPSFDQSKKSFNEVDSTFQTEGINNAK